MKLRIIGLSIAMLLMVACSKEKKESPENNDGKSATSQTYVPPIGNKESEQNPPSQNEQSAATQDVPTNQQQPITMPTKKLTDAEIKTLSKVLAELQKLNVESQQVMIKEVQKQGLDVNKFMEIQQSMRTPTAPKNYTEADKKKYDLAVVELGKIQTQMRGKMEGVLKKQNVTMQDYQKMMIAVQTDPEAQQKLMQMNGMSKQTPAPKK